MNNQDFSNGIVDQQSVNLYSQTTVNAVEIQSLEETNTKLKKRLTRDQILLSVLIIVTVIVFVARFVI